MIIFIPCWTVFILPELCTLYYCCKRFKADVRSVFQVLFYYYYYYNSVKEEFLLNRTALKAIFKAVFELCGQQGIALRGHRDEESTSNFHCLMNLIGKFDPKVCKYVTSEEKTKYLSKDIQNEVLQFLSHSVLRNLVDRIKTESIGKSKEPLFSIIIDETSDINHSEQVSFCVRFCNSKIESEEVFFEFHKTSRTDSETLFNMGKSSLLSFGLSLSGVRGQGYDGASNMAGRQNGLQAKILAENRKALYLYCFDHQLYLIIQDSLKPVLEVALALERMNTVVHFIKNSPKSGINSKILFNETINWCALCVQLGGLCAYRRSIPS